MCIGVFRIGIGNGHQPMVTSITHRLVSYDQLRVNWANLNSSRDMGGDDDTSSICTNEHDLRFWLSVRTPLIANLALGRRR